jgi:hypothetical protein
MELPQGFIACVKYDWGQAELRVHDMRKMIVLSTLIAPKKGLTAESPPSLASI